MANGLYSNRKNIAFVSLLNQHRVKEHSVILLFVRRSNSVSATVVKQLVQGFVGVFLGELKKITNGLSNFTNFLMSI